MALYQEEGAGKRLADQIIGVPMKARLVSSRLLSVAILLVFPWAILAESFHQSFATKSDEELLELVKSRLLVTIDFKDDSECTALHYAVRYGRIKTARWLIEHGADVNTVAYSGFTPMHMVSDGGLAELLIHSGADLKRKDVRGTTPLWRASESGFTNVCEAILAAGFPIDLVSALRLGKLDQAKAILQKNPTSAVDTTSLIFGGVSVYDPLGAAIALGDLELVQMLLTAGAPINKLTSTKSGVMTPLGVAVRLGKYEIAELLCNAGADCDVTMVSRNRYPPSLLDYAIATGDRRMADLLSKYGAKKWDPKNSDFLSRNYRQSETHPVIPLMPASSYFTCWLLGGFIVSIVVIGLRRGHKTVIQSVH
jgi:ankyrin repeat protein